MQSKKNQKKKAVKKGILLKKLRNHSKSLKLQQNTKICHKFT